MELTRRAVLGCLGAVGSGGLAGCSGGSGSTGSSNDGSSLSGIEPPTATESIYVGHDIATLSENLVSGGVPKDGIPSIDEPTFQETPPTSLGDGDPVFGVVRNGEAKAYPQYLLTHHEIVNDTVGGDPVAVTYCPLTGTAQGFERGETEFGVSGRLVNSNLTMYDRGTDSWWPQMTATAIRGPLAGKHLREFRVVWTTWGEWKAAYPDTVVLTEDTGYARRYGNDPYGQYNPREGYYASEQTLFDPLTDDDRAEPKRVGIGMRTANGALVFDKQRLLSDRVRTGMIADTEYVAVAGETLSTGYVYANPDARSITPVAEGYRVDGGVYDAESLPLARTLAFDGMWFAWAGFYPEVPYVR